MSFSEGKYNFFQKVCAFTRQNWKKILIWILAALACLYGSFMTVHLSRYNLPWNTTVEFPHYGRYNPHPSVPGTVELQPQASLEQAFTAMGNIVGSCSELYLKVDPEIWQGSGRVSAELWSEQKQNLLTKAEAELSELPEDGIHAVHFPEEVILKSGEDYRLVITNTASEGSLPLCVDHSIQSGTLTANGEKLDGALTYGFLRTSMYTPSRILKCMILLTCATVLIGLALVLFFDVKEHVLYLILAVGFGIVTLFDLTPLYGFDMRFQFDSAYVVSNELLGMEGAVQIPSKADPETMTTGYYRRACDDYSMFQFYQEESVSDNYTDVAAAIRDLRPEPEKLELVLTETNQGYVGDQLYILYLPQAIGFSIARLLGLGFLPMVQLGRAVPYMLFVLLMFFAIRAVPFGKRVFLILALLPAILTETVSVNRDSVIFSLSFFLIAKVLQAAYAERKPTIWDWTLIFAVSALLAPCKAVYLPLSFFWILAVYRRYLYKQKIDWRKVSLCIAGGILPILVSMMLGSSISVLGMLGDIFKAPGAVQAAVETAAETAETVAEAAVPAEMFNFPYILAHLPQAFMVLMNTLRIELGDYLLNAIQLYAIHLGSNHGVTVLILALLLIECCHDGGYQVLRPAERYFSLFMAIVLFLTTALAALQWTEAGSYVIFGIQGRYLLPALPLLCIFLMNNCAVKIRGNTAMAVKACCCIFPALYLMNMYLWTISR